mgnify:FL=1
MELTNQQEQVVFNSIKLNCQQCLKLSSGICRGEGCELFVLKQTLDDKINGEEKRRVETINKLSNKLNSQRTKLNNLRKEKEQLVQQRKSISELINRYSTQIYNAEKSYTATQKELEVIKYGKPVTTTVHKTKRSKSINTPEDLYNKITELKNEFRNTTNQIEKARLSKRIWYYRSKLKEIQKSNLQNKH